jgi:hypothetical protein
MIVSPGVFAQEWSAAQKEVWKNVQTYWDLATKGDLEGFISYFHKDFSGWINGAHLPHDQATRVKFIKFNMPRSKNLFSDIQPLAIKNPWQYRDCTLLLFGSQTKMQKEKI